MEIFASSSPPAPPQPFHALIVAGGHGARVGGAVPKQYQKLCGKPVLRYTIEAFLATPGLQSIKVVIHPDHIDLYNACIDGLDLPPPVYGREERYLSVYNGLLSLSHLRDDEAILIHDAARPFVQPESIQELARSVSACGAATLALPVSDTLRHTNGQYVDRDKLWALQTPQGFHYGLIRKAHKSGTHHTDDTSMVAAIGHDVMLVEGSRLNFKITTADDMINARLIARSMQSTETRTGNGFDVHAFDPHSSGPIRLCGVDIPHDCRLAGHSDADVGLHALTDALLGAIACGDIGQHFPPSDPQWKGKDSAFFLRHAVDLLSKHTGRILNLDLTLICEAPKISPHKDQMQASIAAICGIEPHRVSIKATTSEKLGFTGRREGIAAQATAHVEIKVPE